MSSWISLIVLVDSIQSFVPILIHSIYLMILSLLPLLIYQALVYMMMAVLTIIDTNTATLVIKPIAHKGTLRLLVLLFKEDDDDVSCMIGMSTFATRCPANPIYRRL